MNNKARTLITAVTVIIAIIGISGAVALNSSTAHALTFSNDYPDGDAVDCSALYGQYSWCKSGAQYSSRSYSYRNCTDGAAYWAKKYVGYSVPSNWGNAKTWDTKAAGLTGVSVKAGNDSTVDVGDIAQSDYGTWGHVGFVTNVVKSGSTVTSLTIAEMNMLGTGVFSSTTYTSKDSGGTFNRSPSTVMKWDHFIDVGTAADTPPPEPPDTDGDGVLNAQDNCPNVYAKTNNGCPKSDFNRDGHADITSFYKMDPPAVSAADTPYKWTWQGKSDASTTANGWLWPEPSVAGWNATKIIQAGTGDFNGDKKQDTATFYNHPNGMMDIDVWYGDGVGGSTQEAPWHISTGWYADRVIPAGVGDFNNDGKDDIAAFYRHDNNLTVLNIWWGNQVTGGNPQLITGGTEKWNGPGWDGYKMISGGVTDINGDGKLEIIAYYNHTSGQLDINTWTAPNNSTDNFTLRSSPARSYTAASGWQGDRIIPAGAGDFNKDGRGDLAAFYRRDDKVTMLLWKGQSDGSFAERSEPWNGLSWEGNRMMPSGVSDYNGDGKLDIASFYRRDNGAMDINIWYDQYGDTATYAPNYAFQYLAGSGWDGYRLNPVKW